MLTKQLDADILSAMKNKETGKLRALRGLKQLVTNKRTEKSNQELTDDDFLAVVQKAIKSRKESADIYSKEGRADLLEIEQEEIDVLQVYLPKQASTEEVTEVIKEIMAQVSATSIKDMGKVMGLAQKQLAGQTDNKTISDIVRSQLSLL